MSSIVLRGLPNIGATCYLNSILQILCNTAELHTLLSHPVASHNTDKQANTICDAFESWLKGHLEGNDSNVSLLATFVKTFIRYFKTFNGGMQDQHEYLMLLLKIIHDCRSSPCMFNITGNKQSPLDDLEEMALNNLRQDGMWTSFDNLGSSSGSSSGLNLNSKGYVSVIFSKFTGQLHARTLCAAENCGYVSHRFETFRIIDVDLGSDLKTLEDCLNWTTREIKLDDSNTYECDKCKRLSRAVRKITLWRLPPVLIFCLKRFNALFKDGQVLFLKNNDSIDIPEFLNMTSYLSLPEIAHGKVNYELYAIAHHIGTQQGGHCYSYLKNSDGSWYAVDDANVVKLKHPAFNGSTPYLLFYRLK